MVDREVQNAIKNQVPRVGKSALKKEINTKFKKIKKEMITEFLTLPVTQELLGGPDAPNISGTLNGFTSLFAFIGFDQGDDPIAPILALLESVVLQYDSDIKGSGRGFGVNFKVTLPEPAQIFAVTPLPWATARSWAEGIERGLSGLGHLLRKNKGRSGAAIQTRTKVRGGKFQNAPYISAFLKKYKKKFEELK